MEMAADKRNFAEPLGRGGQAGGEDALNFEGELTDAVAEAEADHQERGEKNEGDPGGDGESGEGATPFEPGEGPPECTANGDGEDEGPEEGGEKWEEGQEATDDEQS
jgi:hypothetical protein